MATGDSLTARAAWLERRRRGVGASEAAAILNLSPWQTPLEVYLHKTCEIPDRPSTPRQLWGLRMEPVLTAAYVEITGRQVETTQEEVEHPKHPWMLATLDHRASDRVVELKRVNQYAAGEFGPDGSDQIPHYYMLQVQQQMACAGVELADLAALIGDCDFRVYTIPLNPGIVDRLAEAEREFMDRVYRRDPPLPDFTHPTTAEILAMIEPDVDEVVELGKHALELVEHYEAIGQMVKAATDERDTVKARLLHAMGTAGKATLPDGRTLTRKLVESRGYSVGPKSYYKFSIHKPKGAKHGHGITVQPVEAAAEHAGDPGAEV